MNSITKYFRLARQAAIRGNTRKAKRQYRLGAVGIRTDGTVVYSNNIPNRSPEPAAHAEARIVKKLDWGSTVYVVRILSDGKLAMARPCLGCQAAMRLKGVRCCYYSINNEEYGVWQYA